MIRNFLKYSLITVIAISSGCATTVKVKLLRAPEVNLGARRKIAVLNFAINGNMSDFYSRNYSLTYFSGSHISDEIINKLIANKHYTVIEREQLSKIIGEQGLSGSGFVNTDSAIKLGKLFGVEAIMMGSGDYSVNEDIYRQDDSKVYSDKVVKYEKATLYRKTNLKISYRIVDTQTGEILTSQTLSNPNTSYSYNSFPLKGSEKIEYINSGSIYNDPFKTTASPAPINNDTLNFYSIEQKANELQKWNNMIDESLSTLSGKIVKQIAPYYVEEDREIKDGNSDNMKQALQLAKNGSWENAKYLWEAIIKDSSPEAVKDYGNAMYNLANYYELNNDFDNAILYFEQAFKYSNNNEYLKDKVRAEKRKEEINNLKQQGRDKDINPEVKNRIPVSKQTDMIDHAQLAGKFYSSGNLDEAIKEYDKAIMSKPNDSSLHNNLAIIYYSKKNFTEAINHYNTSISLNPNDPASYYNLGLSYHSLGKINEAKIQYGKACQMNFKSACDILLTMN